MSDLKKKLLIFAILALFCCVLLCGCNGNDTPGAETTGENSGEETEAAYDGPASSLELISGPVRTLYADGEKFDTTGIVVKYTIDGESGIAERVYTSGSLKAGDSSVTVTYKKGTLEIPVTVIGGKAGKFESTCSQKKYNSIIEEYARKNKSVENNWYNTYTVYKKLDNPAPDGVTKSIKEFVDYVDYHVFYHIDSVIVKPEFSYGHVNDLLEALYYRSGIISSCASVDCNNLNDGYIQIVLKYYDSTVLVTDTSGVLISNYIHGDIKPSTRSADYTFGLIDKENGITVYNSEQLQYALSRGISVCPVEESPAEQVLAAATSALIKICDDSMTPFEKMYSVYSWLLSTAAYDLDGEDYAGQTLDYERESDMVGALLASFHADGPLLYGNAVCYGYAKAYAIMLALEGLDVTRVTGHESITSGRSAFAKDSANSWNPAICTHSYLYINIDGKDYLSDVTFSYAGNVTCGNGVATWYRDFALAITKEEHSQVYTDMIDWFSSSAEYNPGSYCYLNELKYNGTDSFLIQDSAGLDRYMSAISEKIKSSAPGYYYVNCTVKKSAGNAEMLKMRIKSVCASIGSDYSFGVTERSYLGEEYFGFLLLIKK